MPTHLDFISEWRLRSALSSADASEALMLQLGVLAAGCFTLGGRKRSAGLLLTDTALLLLRYGTAAMRIPCLACLAQTHSFWIQGRVQPQDEFMPTHSQASLSGVKLNLCVCVYMCVCLCVLMQPADSNGGLQRWHCWKSECSLWRENDGGLWCTRTHCDHAA